jgi:hypothetical protein
LPDATWVPVVQLVPPTRTLYVPFSLACQVTSVEVSDALSVVFETVSIVTVGGVVSFVTDVVVEPTFVAASVTQTRIVFDPSASELAFTVVVVAAGAV